MKKVLLLLCKGTEIFEASAFIDVLGWSGTDGLEALQVVSVGFQPEVVCTFGLRIRPDMLIADVRPEEYAAIAIPGGFEEYGFYEEAYDARTSALIQAFAAAGKPVTAICVGALPVAKSGVLQGKRATTYHLGGKRRPQLAALGAEVIDAPFVQDGNIVTSSAPVTAIEVALRLLALLTGQENADIVRHAMGFQKPDYLE